MVKKAAKKENIPLPHREWEEFAGVCRGAGGNPEEALAGLLRCYSAYYYKVAEWRGWQGPGLSTEHFVDGEELKKWLPFLDKSVDIYDENGQYVRWGCWNADRIRSERTYRVMFWNVDFEEVK